MAKKKRRPDLDKERTRARAATKDITTWLSSFGDELIADAIADLKGKPRRVSKAKLTSRQRRLLAILQRHGLRQMRDAARENKRGYEIPNRRVAAYTREKTILVQKLTKKIEKEFRKSLAAGMSNWMAEKPTPSVGEIARRIRTEFFIKPELEGRAGLKPIKGGKGLVRTVHGRAELIARTEIGNARAVGHMDGMKAAGVKWKRWVATVSDRKSGDRRHWEMDGVIIPMGQKFKLPDKTRMSSPKIGPIHQIANCRCRMVASRRGPK